MQGPVVINGNPVINNLSDAMRYAVNANSYEFITQSLYDSAAYATGGQNQLTYFQTPIGAGTGVISAAAKTPEDTNMLGAGAMPNMQAYVITSIELDVQPAITFTAAQLPAFSGAVAVAATVNDVWKVRATGYLNLQIGSKSYITEGPLMKFPASNDLEIDAAVAVGSGDATGQRIAYAKAIGPAYILAPNNLLLIPMQNFSLTLNWGTVQTITTSMRIFARLMGQLIRASQ